MIDTSRLSSLLGKAGITFASVGGDLSNAPRTLSWSGVQVRIDGLADESVEAAQAVLDANPLTLDQLRQAAAQRIATGYANAVAGGYTPSGEEWSISAESQTDVTGLGLRIIIEQMQATDIVKLPTSAGAIPITVQVAQTILVLYGRWMTPKREQLSQKTADAATAATVEAANAIVWS
jgi:hypothetical protein